MRKQDSKPNHNPSFGTPLYIPLPKENVGNKISVTVHYNTTPESEALVWLEPSQTLGKKKPFMFSQCQAIHARSLLPCQDTPEAKATYDASITCDDNELVVVMGALPKDSTSESRESKDQLTSTDSSNSNSSKKVFEFVQKIPISSYLIAISAGNLSSAKIGPRSYLFTEPEQLDAFAHEFEDTEAFIAAAESFLEPYAWDQYNLLIASPSYNFGGMENPNCTLCSASLLAGDKSLVSVVAHEISHSWSGNLVTNKVWSDFWLNEGFTVYLERRILSRIYGQEYADFMGILGRKSLDDSIDNFLENEKVPEFTKLRPDLNGVDPDDSFSSIPYEKGFNFLYYLTQVVGGFENFESFLKNYFKEFAYKTVTTDDFKNYFLSQFENKVDQVELDKIDWDAWLYGVGKIPVENNFDRTLADRVEIAAQSWISGHSQEKDESWQAMQYVYLLQKLQQKKDWTIEEIEKIDQVYEFTKSKNSEISFAWQILCIQSDYKNIFPLVSEFLSRTGRMKYVRPLYRALLKSKEGRTVAEETLEKNKYFYMTTTYKLLIKDFRNATA